MSLLCAVQTTCWLCILFSSVILIGLILTIWNVTISDTEFCTRAQLLIGAECAQKTRNVEDELLKINKTVRFLRAPSEYDNIIGYCNQTKKCLMKLTCSDGHDFVDDVRNTIPGCPFYSFYGSEFRECADTLISKSSNYTCLDVLFNTKHLMKLDRCKQWRDIQPCVYDAIQTECNGIEDTQEMIGNSTELVNQYKYNSIFFYQSMNCDPEPNDIRFDYELINSI